MIAYVIVLMLVLGLILYAWIYQPPVMRLRIDEGFATDDIVAEEKKLMTDFANDIKKSKKEWVSYVARYRADQDAPYVMLHDKDIVLEGKVLSDDGKRRIELTNVKDKKKRVLVLTETAPNEYRGALNGDPMYVRYRNRKERILIKMDKAEITGKGSLGHAKSLPKPWFETTPLVFRENGNNPVGALTYPWKNKKIKDSVKAIPLEISVPKEKAEMKAVPIFAVYILLQETLAKKI